MVEAYADLDDALVQLADRPRLTHPQSLKSLMALVELATVELFDPSDELGGWTSLGRPGSAIHASTGTRAPCPRARRPARAARTPRSWARSACCGERPR